MESPKELNKRIMIAYKRNDKTELSLLYENLGMHELDKNNINSGCFFLTNAYVYALEEGLKSAKTIHKVLKHYGREK